MKYNLVQYGCDSCGELTPVLDADQPLPKGWVYLTTLRHLCPKCKIKKMNEKELEIIKDNAVSESYLQNWYQDSVDESNPPIWTDKHIEELYRDFYLIPKNIEL